MTPISPPLAPSPKAGMADMPALLAIEQSVRIGANVAVQTPARGRHPDATLLRSFAPTTKRLLIS